MRTAIHNEIATLRTKLISHLEEYGRERGQGHLLVGQFIDREGVGSQQQGIYGSAGWLHLIQQNGNPPSNSGHCKLWNSCKDYLERWTLNDEPSGLATVDANHFRSCVKELQNVVPKICSAWQALERSGNRVAAECLYNRLSEAPGAAQGKWSFVISPNVCMVPIATAAVVRTLGSDSTFKNRFLIKSIEYLNSSVDQETNPFARLYILNTLFATQCNSADETKKKKIRKKIRATIRLITQRVVKNPAEFANPLPLEFNDNDRLRYIRYSGDLILLESLAALSTLRSSVFLAGPGARLWCRFKEALSEQTFEKNTTGDRLSISTCVEMNQVLDALDQVPYREGRIAFHSWCTWFQSQRIFGPLFSLSVLKFLVWSIAALVTFSLGYSAVGSTLVITAIAEMPAMIVPVQRYDKAQN